MDTSEILKCIKHFYCSTLSAAYNYPTWNKEDITNAFKLAKLCEQIYQDEKNKSFAGNLDELIHSLRVENYESICLEDLRSSSTFLMQALFENPYIENETLENIFHELKNEGEISGDIFNLCDLAELDTTCIELIEATKPIKLKNSDRSIYFEIKSEMLLNFLCNRSCEQTTEQQIESRLFEAFESLCQNEENMMTLLHILMSENSDTSQRIQEYCINWVLLKILNDETCFLAEFLWKQSPTSLRKISKNSTHFFSFYSNFLTRKISSMKDEFEDLQSSISSFSNDRLQNSSCKISFEEILKHFHCLLCEDDEIGESTKLLLLDLVNNSSDRIWKEIFSRIC